VGLDIGEAAFHAASFLRCWFSVITTLRRSMPGIDGGTCATTFAEALVAAGLKTSKIGGYHYVRLADVRVGVL
jgi:Asp/Glu/hydantoin racemase